MTLGTQPLPREQELELVTALVAAYRPRALPGRLNEHLVSQALENVLAPALAPSAAEVRGTLWLVDAIEAACRPRELDPGVNEQLVEAALTDPLAPATPEELVESERLRAALDGGGRHPLAELAVALNAAAGTRPLSSRESRTNGRRAKVLYVAFGAAAAVTALAAAAAMVLFPVQDPLRPLAESRARRGPTEQLAVSRTTAGLFASRYEIGRATERLDRIAEARRRDLRQNRYLGWGVR